MELSDGMDIAAYAVSNSQSRIMNAVGVSLLKQTMDDQEMMGEQLTKMMELSVNPSLGANIDVLA